MLAKALVIAMAADIARSDYAKPTLIRSRSREWLIACRWGPEGEYLSIATAGPITEPLALVAPQVIAPIHSLVGVLVSESESQSTSTFLLVRQLPGAIELAGTFFPADGYVLLQDHGDIHLVCKARYSHSCGWLDGKEIRKDIPDPAPYSAEAMSWHIEATRRDWIGEFIPGAGRRSGLRFARPADASNRIAGRHKIAARLPAEDYPREGNFRRSPRSTVLNARPWPSLREFDWRCFQPASRCKAAHADWSFAHRP